MPNIGFIAKVMIMIHTDDHEPAHVTFYLGKTKEGYEARARIEVKTGRIMDATGFREKTLNEFSKWVLKRQDFCQRRWNETRPKK